MFNVIDIFIASEIVRLINYLTDDIRATEDDFSDTVSSPATPMTPSTPCTPASDHDTDKSGFRCVLKEFCRQLVTKEFCSQLKKFCEGLK